VTHEQEMVRHFGGRIITIDSGQVVFDGEIPPDGRLAGAAI